MTTQIDLHPEAIAAYRTTMQQRGQHEKKIRQEKQVQAHQIAQQAADILRGEFAATKVVLFGSLAHQRWFSATSDIDLAVWGLDSGLYFSAVARLQELSSAFKIDLVDMNNCLDKLCDAIKQEGQAL
jgi:predicted nucleotidyltransferase